LKRETNAQPVREQQAESAPTAQSQRTTTNRPVLAAEQRANQSAVESFSPDKPTNGPESLTDVCEKELTSPDASNPQTQQLPERPTDRSRSTLRGNDPSPSQSNAPQAQPGTGPSKPTTSSTDAHAAAASSSNPTKAAPSKARGTPQFQPNSVANAAPAPTSSTQNSVAAERGSGAVRPVTFAPVSDSKSPAQSANTKARLANLARPTPFRESIEERSAATQVSRGLAEAIRSGAGEARLRLSPDALGTVFVDLKINGTSVEAILHAGTDSARGLLEDNLNGLKTALEAHGLTVQSIAVEPRETPQATLDSGGTGVGTDGNPQAADPHTNAGRDGAQGGPEHGGPHHGNAAPHDSAWQSTDAPPWTQVEHSDGLGGVAIAASRVITLRLDVRA
jgi:flagellar hook-length control protein FliK